MLLHCCGCNGEVYARLTDGGEIYPHREDLSYLPFWVCDTCGNYVGCHHKTKDPTRPLGCIPTKELRKARGALHSRIDRVWKMGIRTRKEVYKSITYLVGYEFHCGEIKTLEEADRVVGLLNAIDNWWGS